MAPAPVSVIELPRYLRDAGGILSADERDEVINTIAFQRGGARVIYYFHNEGFPAFLLAIFAKNERPDLSARQKREYSEMVRDIVGRWKKQ